MSLLLLCIFYRKNPVVGCAKQFKIFLAFRTKAIFKARGAKRISETIRELRSNDKDCLSSRAQREIKKRAISALLLLDAQILCASSRRRALKSSRFFISKADFKLFCTAPFTGLD